MPWRSIKYGKHINHNAILFDVNLGRWINLGYWCIAGFIDIFEIIGWTDCWWMTGECEFLFAAPTTSVLESWNRTPFVLIGRSYLILCALFHVFCIKMNINCWLVGLEHFFDILGTLIPTDFHIFQRGSNHQPGMIYNNIVILIWDLLWIYQIYSEYVPSGYLRVCHGIDGP